MGDLEEAVRGSEARDYRLTQLLGKPYSSPDPSPPRGSTSKANAAADASHSTASAAVQGLLDESERAAIQELKRIHDAQRTASRSVHTPEGLGFTSARLSKRRLYDGR